MHRYFQKINSSYGVVIPINKKKYDYIAEYFSCDINEIHGRGSSFTFKNEQYIISNFFCQKNMYDEYVGIHRTQGIQATIETQLKRKYTVFFDKNQDTPQNKKNVIFDRLKGVFYLNGNAPFTPDSIDIENPNRRNEKFTIRVYLAEDDSRFMESNFVRLCCIQSWKRFFNIFGEDR